MRRRNPVVPYHIFLSGPGGVGKSHVIKLIHADTVKILRHSQQLEPSDILVMLLAPTGLGKLQLLIIDECSMVGCELLNQIHRRLQDIKDSNECFGGVSILAVGDLYQLRPVMQGYIFQQPHVPLLDLYGSLWKENFVMHELTTIVRQKDDKRFGQLLNRIRLGKATDDDLNLLRSRQIELGSETYRVNNLEHELHIYANNVDVNKHNENCLSLLDEEIIVIKAVDSSKDDQTKQSVIRLPNNPSKTAGLIKEVKIAKGARVVITYNIDVSKGIVNGAVGCVTNIIRSGQNLEKIFVKFDNPKIANNKEFGLERISNTFKIGQRKSGEVTRKQFPISLAWAETIHKTQGKTVEKIVFNMNKGRFSAGQAYVAMSCVTTMNGLFVVGVNPSQITVAKEVEEEMERLKRSPLKHTDSEIAYGEDNIGVCRLALLNVAGILNKKVDLEIDDAIADCDVISLVETWLKPGNKLSMFSKDHSAFRLDRHDVVGLENVERGGVIVYVKSNMKAKQLHYQVQNLEAIILDHIYVPSEINSKFKIQVKDCYYTDHRAVIVHWIE